MKILFVGDITGAPGRAAVKKFIPKFRKSGVDFFFANAENSAGGSGITPAMADELFGYGLDAITSGDHIWKKKEIYEIIDKDDRIVRPANYPEGAPGHGSVLVQKDKGKVGVINIVGRVFMDAVDCPFKAVMREIEELKKDTNIILVDIHAEATSEKVAMGWYLDGKVSAVVGTHTHIQTADEKILPKGTAYITDLGMAGPYESVIGRRVEQILTRFLTRLPVRFEMAENDVQLHGVVIEIDDKTGKATSIRRVQEKL